MKKRYKIGLLCLTASLLFVGCSAPKEEKKEESVKQKSVSRDMPAIHITMNDKEIPSETATYEWKEKGVAKEVEKGSVEDIAKNMESHVAEPGEIVQVYFDKKDGLQKAFIRKWDNQTASDVKQKDYRFQLPKKEGTYVYEILAYYETGNIQHVLKVEVKDEGK